MKHLHYFEDVQQENNIETPQIDDYVYCVITDEDYTVDGLRKFVGKMIKYSDRSKYPYVIQYPILKNIEIPIDATPTNSAEFNLRFIKKSEVIDFSKNIEDLEHYTILTKYNL